MGWYVCGNNHKNWIDENKMVRLRCRVTGCDSSKLIPYNDISEEPKHSYSSEEKRYPSNNRYKLETKLISKEILKYDNINKVKDDLIKHLQNYCKSSKWKTYRNHRGRANLLIEFINKSNCCYEIYLIIKYQLSLFYRGYKKEIRAEIKKRLDFEHELLSDSFNSGKYRLYGDFFKKLILCKDILEKAGYSIDLNNNDIYIHFVYVGGIFPIEIMQRFLIQITSS